MNSCTSIVCQKNTKMKTEKQKKIKPQKALILCGFPPARPAPQDTKNGKRMRKKIVHPGQHERAITVIPSPSLRCAACAAAGAGVHTTVYIKPPPAPADRDAAKGIQKKEEKKCTRYCIHDESNCVHTTVYNAALIMYILPCTPRGGLCTHYRIQKERNKKRSKKDRLGCTQMKGGFACGSRRNRCKLGCTKIKKKLYTLGWLIGCWSIR